jgi:nitric oxide reductase subunit C
MPNLALTKDEARALIAFLKWTSAIDTNGFPRNFTPIRQEGDR